eukprot:14223968-Alexandrium_andersonii.AAC.1
MEQLKQWSERPVRDEPAAVIVLGPPDEAIPHKVMQVPVRVSEGEAQGTRKFMKGAIYQLCLSKPVECLTTPQQVSPEA